MFARWQNSRLAAASVMDTFFFVYSAGANETEKEVKIQTTLDQRGVKGTKNIFI